MIKDAGSKQAQSEGVVETLPKLPHITEHQAALLHPDPDRQTLLCVSFYISGSQTFGWCDYFVLLKDQ
jgi:hypothetical protein